MLFLLPIDRFGDSWIGTLLARFINLLIFSSDMSFSSIVCRVLLVGFWHSFGFCSVTIRFIVLVLMIFGLLSKSTIFIGKRSNVTFGLFKSHQFFGFLISLGRGQCAFSDRLIDNLRAQSFEVRSTLHVIIASWVKTWSRTLFVIFDQNFTLIESSILFFIWTVRFIDFVIQSLYLCIISLAYIHKNWY